ncbi:ABC transporter permease [Bacillus sp. JCM 19034]|uniref:ABC transporter permease n=1 Tax=Bacillus sp. JCM 19034 TaxID=1481928 RepID=UPI000784EB6C|nr:ABC transporter permease [Bacillus sp. JCM 19034]
MNKFWTIFKFTYLKTVLSNSFIVVSLIFIVGIVGFANFDKIKDWFQDEENLSVAIVTSDDSIYDAINENKLYITPNTTMKKTTKDRAFELLESNDISRIYSINRKDDHNLEAEIIYKDSIQQTEKDNLQHLLTQIQFDIKSAMYGLTDEQMNDLKQSSSVVAEKTTHNVDKNYSSDESELISTIALVSIFIMFIIILSYSNQAALEIATEKNSKVMEMVITSVSPIIHLWGKITALIMAGLTQVLIIAITLIISYFSFDGNKLFNDLHFEITENIIWIFILSLLFVLIGLATYIIFAMIIGSMTTNLENMSQAVMPLNILLFIPMYLIVLNTDAPESSIIEVTSFIPFFSPFTMILRLTTPEVSGLEIFISLVFSLILIILLSWIASRSYKSLLLSFDINIIKSVRKTLGK